MGVYDGREIVSIMQAMKIVGVSRRTIYNWLDANKIEYVRTAGGSIRIFRETLFRRESPNEQISPKTNNERQEGTDAIPD